MRSIIERIASGQLSKEEGMRQLMELKQADRLETVFYAEELTERELYAPASSGPGNLLVFVRDGSQEQLLRQVCSSKVDSLTVVAPGEEMHIPEGAEHARIRVDRREDYALLFAQLERLGRFPDSILHLLAEEEAGSGSMEAALKNGIHSVLAMSQALLASGKRAKTNIVIHYTMCGSHALNAALDGFTKSAMIENPGLRFKTVSTDYSRSAFTPKTVEMLLRELGEEPGASRVVHYRDGLRLVPVLTRKPPEGLTGPDYWSGEGKAYVITGGMGALGYVLAGYLASTRKARLLLTGRTPLSGAIQAKLDALNGAGGEAYYLCADAADPAGAQALLAEAKARFSRVSGILHCAGTKNDSFLLHKDPKSYNDVIAAKVNGTVHLYEAFKGEEPDFLLLFSSISAIFGNMGQSDYAYANRFMDYFAAERNDASSFRVMSVNWPLWTEGGMTAAGQSQEALKSRLGLWPLPTEEGLRAFSAVCGIGEANTVVLYGEAERIAQSVTELNEPRQSRQPEAQVAGQEQAQTAGTPSQAVRTAEPQSDAEVLRQAAESFLQGIIIKLTKIPAHTLGLDDSFEKIGLDSIMAMSINEELEAVFGELSKTLLFEYQTIRELSGYFVESHAHVLSGMLKPAQKAKAPQATGAAASFPASAPAPRTPYAKPAPFPVQPGSRKASAVPAKEVFRGRERPDHDIAIVGVSGKFPMSPDLQVFWKNLAEARDCITEIPGDRWSIEEFYTTDKNKLGKMYCKWGGFIDDVDRFDALFFNISPREAEIMDPQERLFLECAYSAIEDAGYTRDSLDSRKVGVFAGVMYGQYQLMDAEMDGQPIALSSVYASIANRVSYHLNLNGPSIALDTMCSSSLTSIHLACDSIRRGESDYAIAGGVNVSIHPDKYIFLSQQKFAASDGRCHSFGEGGDGYVPGEGVGAVLLKPLDRAVRDGDHVYAVIKGSSINHGGKTSGYTVPNPSQQGAVIQETLQAAGVHPRTINYIEAHGTGTTLGDPIEVSGLVKAFKDQTSDLQFCAIGSVKSNIGHCESAAGIAAIIKVLLQMKYGMLAPSIHSEELNGNIRFQDTPFFVQRRLGPWERVVLQEGREKKEYPRRAGVSSFGAGGANAHIILEEYIRPAQEVTASPGEQIIVLSSKSEDRLKAYARKLGDYLETLDETSVRLEDVAYTLQTGREPFGERLALVAGSLRELRELLQAYLEGSEEPSKLFAGSTKKSRELLEFLSGGIAGSSFAEMLLNEGDSGKIARMWTLGLEVDWSRLHALAERRRIPLPTYPFARNRYWVSEKPRAAAARQSDSPAAASTVSAELQTATGGYRNGSAALAASSVQSDQNGQASLVYYTPEWEASPLSLQDGGLKGDVVLLLGDRGYEDQLPQIRRTYSAAGRLAVVSSGRDFQETGEGRYTLRFDRKEDFRQLLASLGSSGFSLGQFIYLAAAESTPAEGASAEERLQLGLYPLLFLTQALMEHKADRVKLVYAYEESANLASVLDAALGGFMKTLRLESPGYMFKAVGFAGPLLKDAITEVLPAELAASGQEAEAAYRNGSRFVKRLVPLPEQPAPQAAAAVKEKGVYLITGGLGGLGSLFASHLAASYGAAVILTGRSALNEEKERRLSAIASLGGQVEYVVSDGANARDTVELIAAVKRKYGKIDGVLHCAGINRDAYILKKSRSDFEQVIASKAVSTLNLDLALKEEPLDFLVLFSSVTGETGNLGQADYAYANSFMNEFARYRDKLAAEGRRSGRTLSAAWPLWESDGMGLSEEEQRMLTLQTGLVPLPVDAGLKAFQDLLNRGVNPLVVGYGHSAKVARLLESVNRSADRMADPNANRSVRPDNGLTAAGAGALPQDFDLKGRTLEYLTGLFSALLKLDPEAIDTTALFEEYGIESVMVGYFNAKLEEDLGEVSKTLLFEYQTIEALAAHMAVHYAGPLAELLAPTGEALPAGRGETLAAGEQAAPGVYGEVPIAFQGVPAENQGSLHSRTGWTLPAPLAAQAANGDDIAIIGVSGKYPMASDIYEFWDNLMSGKDCISEIPADRWNINQYFDPDYDKVKEGKMYSKWGGFIADVDKFDPAFFHIAPREAVIMDPQERIFAETVWSTLEDAGYTPKRLQRYQEGYGVNVGVFAGATTFSYQMWGPEEWERGNFSAMPNVSPWSIANRISYLFNFSGPSLAIDTACSSSLAALHAACESLKKGECRLAVAGGVNLYLHPYKYVLMCQTRMLSPTGKCRSFGEEADGFVPGEGVGAVLLKPLREAVADKDHIYGVIKATEMNHGGKVHGYTVPNPNAQADLISKALKRAGIDAGSISYMEAHGTGTKLGDPIEINALNQVFSEYGPAEQACAIGSVKSNIGHLEAAAGIASLTKVLLQMKHGQLAPSIHAEKTNANIDFAKSHFYVQREAAPWKAEKGGMRTLRRAGVSSFGAGGSNAYALVEEYAAEPRTGSNGREQILVLSAKTSGSLRQSAVKLHGFLSARPDASLADVAYTLQTGREELAHRLAFVCSGMTELLGKLQAYLNGTEHEGLYTAVAGKRIKADEVHDGTPERIASQWVQGVPVNWSGLHEGEDTRIVPLPTYAFERESYWIPRTEARAGAHGGGRAPGGLHPLVDRNVSSFSSQRFETVVHDAHGVHLAPRCSHIELFRIAAEMSLEKGCGEIGQIVWGELPELPAGQKLTTVLYENGGQIECETGFENGSGEYAVLAQGRLSSAALPQPGKAPAAAADRDMREVQPESGLSAGNSRFAPFRQGLASSDRALLTFRLDGSLETDAGVKLHYLAAEEMIRFLAKLAGQPDGSEWTGLYGCRLYEAFSNEVMLSASWRRLDSRTFAYRLSFLDARTERVLAEMDELTIRSGGTLQPEPASAGTPALL